MFLVKAKKRRTAWRYSLSMKASIKVKENGIFASTTQAVRHYHWNFSITVNLRSRLHAARTSRKTDFRFRLKLKITLEKSTCSSQCPQFHSLSFIFSCGHPCYDQLTTLRKKVSAHQYRVTISRSQVYILSRSLHVFVKLTADQVLIFRMDHGRMSG